MIRVERRIPDKAEGTETQLIEGIIKWKLFALELRGAVAQSV
jgi:hypothetical protein